MLTQSHFALGNTRRGASRFASPSIARYPVRVTETTVTRFGDRRCSKADNRLRAVFLRPYTLRLLWSAPWWGCVRARRFPWTPVRQPCLVPGHPIWRWGRVRQPVQGGRI